MKQQKPTLKGAIEIAEKGFLALGYKKRQAKKAAIMMIKGLEIERFLAKNEF